MDRGHMDRGPMDRGPMDRGDHGSGAHGSGTMTSMWLKAFQNGIIASEHILVNFQCKSYEFREGTDDHALCFFLNPMIQNMMLHQIGVAQEKHKRYTERQLYCGNAIHGSRCVWIP